MRCSVSQLTGFYMMVTLALNELKIHFYAHWHKNGGIGHIVFYGPEKKPYFSV